MAEYIERTEELILSVNAGARAIENTKRYHGASYCFNVFSDNPKEIPYLKAAEVLRGFEEIPAADVAPVRHGRWDDEHKCTVCHNEAFYKISSIRPDYDYDWEENLVETGDYIWDIEWVETAYCPNCGARMLEG